MQTLGKLRQAPGAATSAGGLAKAAEQQRLLPQWPWLDPRQGKTPPKGHLHPYWEWKLLAHDRHLVRRWPAIVAVIQPWHVHTTSVL